MSETYAILCGQDHMTYKDMQRECLAGRWFPILVMRTGEGQPPIIPLFDTEATARQFIKRNLPKEWVCGTLNINLRDAHWLDERGCRAISFDFPRKLKDVVEFDVEILEYEKNHEMVLKRELANAC